MSRKHNFTYILAGYAQTFQATEKVKARKRRREKSHIHRGIVSIKSHSLSSTFSYVSLFTLSNPTTTTEGKDCV